MENNINKSNFKIIAVDDEVQVLDSLKSILERKKFNIDGESNPEKAIEKVMSDKYDLVLLDINMPKISGLTFLYRIRKKYDKINLPVIMLTGQNSDELVSEALRIGANDYVTKPFNIDLFLEKINRLISIKETFRKLSISEKKYRELIENFKIGVFRTSLSGDGKILFANDALKNMYRMPAAEKFTGNKIIDFYKNPEERKNFIEKIKKNGTVKDFEVEQVRADGTEFWISITGTLKKSATDNIEWIEGIVIDITDRKKISQLKDHLNNELEESNKQLNNKIEQLKATQQQLIQADKMSALGILAAGIAHEINQPLTGVLLGIDNISIELDEENIDTVFIKQKCGNIRGYVDRIKKIIEHIRIFSRDSDPVENDYFNVNQSIKNALSLVRTQYRNHDIELEVVLDEELPEIKGNTYKMEQVIINLLSNSKQAIDNKKLQKIEQKNVITINTSYVDNKIIIEIKDNGTGIPKENINKVLDPFFTTNPPDKGTGLGLSISYSIIKDFNGEFFIESIENEFTKVKIVIPIESI